MKKKLFLVFIFVLAVFFRFYKINDFFIFNGDVARDYLSARDISLIGKIPLVGCPSSVPWLHQGAFFIYLLSLPLFIGGYNPISGVIFVSLLGVLNVFVIYFLGKKLFSETAGLWAALFYSTSPIVVLFDRYPYHQSPISLYTILFFLSLHYSIKKNPKFFVFSLFLLGLLMQLELSNLVLVPIAFCIFLIYRKKISLNVLVFSIISFLITWIPKIIWDINNGFSQTFGFVAWMIHKVIPVTFPGDTPTESISFFKRLTLLAEYFSRMIFYPSIALSTVILVALILFLILTKKKSKVDKDSFLLVFLWLAFPVLGFLIHGSPSVSYMPILFALPPLFLGYFIWKLPGLKLKKISQTLLVLFVLLNGFYLIKNNYLFITEKDTFDKWSEKIPSFSLYKNVSKYIVSQSGEKYNLVSVGKLAEFESNIDSFVYINWFLGKPASLKKEKNFFLVYYNFDKKILESKIDSGETVREFPVFSVLEKSHD